MRKSLKVRIQLRVSGIRVCCHTLSQRLSSLLTRPSSAPLLYSLQRDQRR